MSRAGRGAGVPGSSNGSIEHVAEPTSRPRLVVRAVKALLPNFAVDELRRRWRNVGRTSPISRAFGMDRGLPIDRYYIERKFLAAHAADIHGRVLEIADNTYTKRFGGDRVSQSDVLHAVAGNPQATFVGDLAKGDNLPSAAFDCIICTQTLMFVYDLDAAMQTLHRMLKPGGVLLVSVAGISQICRWDADQWGDYWRFTSQSLRRLAESVFAPERVRVQAHGNALIAAAFLFGKATEDVRPQDLDVHDRDYELVITLRAQRS